MKMTSEERRALLALIAVFPRQQVVMLGDLVADEFLFGEISRVSREAPVLILKHRHQEILPGGGANAVNNLADLGARAVPVGAVGQDEAGRALLRQFAAKNIPTSAILRLPRWITPTKSRILAGSAHSEPTRSL